MSCFVFLRIDSVRSSQLTTLSTEFAPPMDAPYFEAGASYEEDGGVAYVDG